MKRRTFLTAGSIISLGIVVGAGPLVVEDIMMKRPKGRDGLILADLHAHPANYHSLDETLQMLSCSGLVGLTLIDPRENNIILTYEQALLLPGVEEIDKGRLAKISYRHNQGYFIKTQEIRVKEEAEHHFLAIGIKEYLPDYSRAEEAVRDVRKQGAIVILNHPYVVPRHPSIGYGLINPSEEVRVNEIAQLVDEIEVFNGQNINTGWLGAMAMKIGETFHPKRFSNLTYNMNLANDLALKLVQRSGHKGTAASDAHMRLEQVGTSGIWIPEKDLSFEGLRYYLLTKQFEREQNYVSRWSFALGMFNG